MAETWITITKALVQGSLSEGEWDAFANAALVPGSPDVVAQAITGVVARVQGAVGASGQNVVGPAGTVPPELQSETLILLLEELASRIPSSGITWDDIRKGRLKEAKDLLMEIRKGDYRTTVPEAAGTVGAAVDGGAYGGEAMINFHGTTPEEDEEEG